MEGDNKAVVIIGPEEFPFPIPLTRKGAAWQFDTAAGRLEILYRRIGRNELSAIQACLAYADAQNEYADKDRTDAGSATYAQRIVSRPGKKDGLYWPGAQGDGESPLGELMAHATTEGYAIGGDHTPSHGCYFKILTRQGPMAAGGEVDYVVRGKMIGGFALVAYPAEYGNSGVMTFVVNYAGIRAARYDLFLNIANLENALFRDELTLRAMGSINLCATRVLSKSLRTLKSSSSD